MIKNLKTSEKLWLDKNRIEILAPYPLEDRRIMIGTIEGKIWTAIFTMRSDAIRIISVRRAREKEVSLYEKESSG
ncbi:MAG: BrnT family toxin [Nitrospirae bacterium]|nr:BrnT family toxin [Nitrospirota bacterium]